ncbi:hypothetical protein NDU88_002356 [Pleurodeles waltl]|uniref:Reverse transcriptase domain-containing protein n=1 Tax=Pleurodeles waltl TaxID=8319 RepID=A0AAV7SDI9_PLEWA|nr:hypothetical protein NDU88_002356 [Pleurodeles waltl]
MVSAGLPPSRLTRRWGGSTAGSMSWGQRSLLAGSGRRKPVGGYLRAPPRRLVLLYLCCGGRTSAGARDCGSEELGSFFFIFLFLEPASGVRAEFVKGRAELHRLVLEKLGSEDTSEVIESPEKEVGRDRGTLPKRFHVAPSAALPPVKRRKNGKALVPASINLTPPTTVNLPAQLILHDTPAPSAVPPPVPPAFITDITAPPGMGVEVFLADMRKSFAALAPTAQSGASPTPFPGLAAPASSGSPPVRVPEHQAQDQNPSRLALLEVSKLLAGINAPATTAPPLTAPWGLNDSWQNAVTDLKRQIEVVAKKLEKERALGRLAGPFKCPLLAGFVCSPLGVVAKKDPGHFRLIHNLSAPRGSSVNDAIDPQLCSVRYASVDNAVDKVRVLGRGALLAKTDIESAFRLLPVHPDDYHLLGFQFRELMLFLFVILNSVIQMYYGIETRFF